MNTDAHYQRRTDRSIAEQPDPAGQPVERSAYARHGDPSAASAREAAAASPPQRSIAWVRPSELPSLAGAPWLRRSADIQAEMVRRARRAPATVTARAGRRLTRTAIGDPEHPIPIEEGLSL